ncbi:MAG TPA: hypothetical protein VFW75_15815 [Acetobacteraceae bacterium]|nr:hypothetical protein [Acetobacteraceae bacterium]
MGASQYGRVVGSSQLARSLAFVAACVLQLLFILAFIELGREHGVASSPQPAVIAFVLPPPKAASASPPAVPLRAQRLSSRLSIPAVPPLLTAPEINLAPAQTGPGTRSRKPPPADWTRAARLAAAQVVDAQALAQRRRQASGEMPWPDAAEPRRAGAPIPWSHQPLTRWFDFDPVTLVSSISLGNHCQLVFFVVLPAFGCILGHIDSGEGGHFDPSFDITSVEPPSLELPGPALPAPRDLHPWSDTTAHQADGAAAISAPPAPATAQR